MLKLVKVNINKYKCFNKRHSVKIDSNITTLVGRNETGKTAFLEALAKLNYFDKQNTNFKLNRILDYPRIELNDLLYNNEDKEAIRCTFEINRKLINDIENDLGKGVLLVNSFDYSVSYLGKTTWYNLKVDEEKFIENLLEKYSDDDDLYFKLKNIKTINEILEFAQYNSEDENLNIIVDDIKNNILENSYKWKNKVKGYVAKNYLKPALPKFWYFDEYFHLPSKININELKRDNLKNNSLRIAKALFELANINIDELLSADDFESYLINLETTSNAITNKIFRYWTTDKNLEVKFEIETNNINEKILNIRIRNSKQKVTLPLHNRSKGLNSFFSFIVWFSKIQSNDDNNFILLLDEPGLNLHAKAQTDMLDFIEDLSKEYQIIYTTHSPFMIDPNHLERVRTVSSVDGVSMITEAVLENNYDALFPLQASIGYSISKDFFTSKKNLLVESPAELLILKTVSNILKLNKKKGLKDEISIIPIGGLNKVAYFSALLRQGKLNFVCLLNSLKNQQIKKYYTRLISEKIIKEKNVRFYDDFLDKSDNVSIEDFFEKEEYLSLFKLAYPEYEKLELSEQDKSSILRQISKLIKKSSFDNYLVASKLLELQNTKNILSKKTINRFEKLFIEINRLLKS